MFTCSDHLAVTAPFGFCIDVIESPVWFVNRLVSQRSCGFIQSVFFSIAPTCTDEASTWRSGYHDTCQWGAADSVTKLCFFVPHRRRNEIDLPVFPKTLVPQQPSPFPSISARWAPLRAGRATIPQQPSPFPSISARWRPFHAGRAKIHSLLLVWWLPPQGGAPAVCDRADKVQCSLAGPRRPPQHRLSCPSTAVALSLDFRSLGAPLCGTGEVPQSSPGVVAASARGGAGSV